MPRGKKTEPATVEVKAEDVMLDDGTSLTMWTPKRREKTFLQTSRMRLTDKTSRGRTETA